jgi:hypothetical protein
MIKAIAVMEPQGSLMSTGTALCFQRDSYLAYPELFPVHAILRAPRGRPRVAAVLAESGLVHRALPAGGILAIAVLVLVRTMTPGVECRLWKVIDPEAREAWFISVGRM